MTTKNDFLEAMNWRYAVKKFDETKKIDKETWGVLEDSLVLTATSFGLMPYKFIIVEDQNLKEQLKAASYNQTQVSDCSHLVVFLAKEKWMKLLFKSILIKLRK